MSSTPTNSQWTPLSWKTKPIVQDVTYEDQKHMDRVIGKLQTLPPLVSSKEVRPIVMSSLYDTNPSAFLSFRID